MNALILFCYGAIESIDEIEGFYDHLTYGNATRDRVDRGVRLFKSIGTCDPLASVTNRIGDALVGRLAQERGEDWEFYIGNKHVYPFVEDAVRECVEDGASHIYTLSLTPLYSKTGTRTYELAAAKALQKFCEGRVGVTPMPVLYDNEAFIGLLAERLTVAVQWLPRDVRDDVEVIFTSHSMPGNQETQADFIRQYESLAASVIDKSPVGSYRLAYRSATPGKQPWLEPDVLDVIREAKEAGRKAVVVSEILSVIENAEAIQEVGRDAKQLAHSLEMEFVQVEYLNDSYDFVEVLVGHLLENLNEPGTKVF